MIMKRREETVTMKLSNTQKSQLQTMGETNKNIGNYEGNYKLIQNGSDEYDEVLSHMNDEDKLYFEQLDSLIEYISLDEFVHVKVQKHDLFKSKLKAGTCKTINNKAIEYEGKSLKDIMKSSELSGKFKQDACVYTALIKLYGNQKKMKLNNEPLDYNNLYEFFNKKPYVDNSDLGLSAKQLKTFFKHFQLECTFLNGQNQNIFNCKPETTKHIKHRHFKAIITNNHIYPIINQLNKCNTKDLDEIKTNEYFNIQTQKQKNEIFIKDKVEIYNIELEEKKFYTFYYGGNLTEILKWLKYDLKYHPEVRYKSAISNIYLKINQSIVNITNHDTTFNEEQTEIRYKETGENTEVEHMKLFKKHDNEFMQALLCKQYLTEYSPSLQQNLFNFPINCAVGHLDTKYKSKYAIDFTKAYSSILYETSFIPVATPFDEFEKYNNEAICDTHLYAIKLKEILENKILSDSSIRLMYGINLLKIMKYQKVEILGICKLNKTQKNQILPSLMDKIRNSKLTTDDWKFIYNKSIGLAGKRYSQGSVSGLYDNVAEAQHYLKEEDSRNFPKNVKDTELWYIEQKGERKALKNGFYLIQALIYDTMRTKLFIMYQELKAQGIEAVSVKTDCIYTNKRPDATKLSFKIGKEFGCIKDVVEETFDCKNELKMHKYNINCCDNCFIKCQLVQKNNIKLKLFKPPTYNEIKLVDEFDNTEFHKVVDRTLIRADLAGAGKTTNVIKYFQSVNKKIIVVCPTNVLALDIQTKFKNVKAITFCNFAGLIVGEDRNKAPFDISSYDVVLIDEIYNLATHHLWKLKKIMDNNKGKIFVSTGDHLQNNPIETVNDETIYNKIIQNLFPNHLQLHESRRLTNKKQKEQLLKLKEFVFSNFNTMPRKEFLKQLEDEFKIRMNDRTDLSKSTNITLFNETAIMVCRHVLSKKKGDNVKCKNFKWCKDIDCYVKNRIVTKDHVFHTNYVYKIVGFEEKNVKLKDEFSQEVYKLEINKLDKNFRPHFALTGHSTQGITTDKTLNVFDVEHKFMTARWLWTALTRTTDLNKINLIARHGDFGMKYNLGKMVENYKEQDIFAGREFNENDFVTAKDSKYV